MLSTPLQTKELRPGPHDPDGGRHDEILIRVPSTVAAGSKITRISFVSKDALAANDTNYVKFGVVINLGGPAAGTQALVDDTAAANSTKVTGGSAIAAYTRGTSRSRRSRSARSATSPAATLLRSRDHRHGHARRTR
jgi:hypothetical protein